MIFFIYVVLSFFSLPVAYRSLFSFTFHFLHATSVYRLHVLIFKAIFSFFFFCYSFMQLFFSIFMFSFSPPFLFFFTCLSFIFSFLPRLLSFRPDDNLRKNEGEIQAQSETKKQKKSVRLFLAMYRSFLLSSCALTNKCIRHFLHLRSLPLRCRFYRDQKEMLSSLRSSFPAVSFVSSCACSFLQRCRRNESALKVPARRPSLGWSACPPSCSQDATFTSLSN